MEQQAAQVKSRHSFTHTDKHHGIEYVFKPNDKVTIPLAAARHLFGLGLKDKKPAWSRLGFTQADEGNKFLQGFEVEAVNLVAESLDVEKIQNAANEKIAGLETENGDLAAQNDLLRQQVEDLTAKLKGKKKAEPEG